MSAKFNTIQCNGNVEGLEAIYVLQWGVSRWDLSALGGPNGACVIYLVVVACVTCSVLKVVVVVVVVLYCCI